MNTSDGSFTSSDLRSEDGRAPSSPINSIENALRLLLVFRARQAIKVSEVSEELGVGRSTAHRMLAILRNYHFVVQDPGTKEYIAGPALLELGLSTVGGVRERARPILERVSRETGETSHLMTLRGAWTIFLDGVESDRPIRAVNRTGSTLPAHCTSGGKALLAQLSGDELRRLFPDSRLRSLTPKSVTELDALERDLALVRKRGYATNYGESEDDLVAVGVAVTDAQGAAREALVVSAPLARCSEDWAERIYAVLAPAAASLSGLSRQ